MQTILAKALSRYTTNAEGRMECDNDGFVYVQILETLLRTGEPANVIACTGGTAEAESFAV